MTIQRFASRLVVLSLAIALCAPSAAAQQSSAAWPQWGGPHRNFTADTKGLADSWPAAGPRQLWSRDLGDGYSAIVSDGARLYTMYRLPARLWQLTKEDQEVVIALDASTGKTVWEYNYDAPHLPRQNMEYGPGPHSTPLIVGDRLFAVGASGKFHALDKATGKLLWSHDFYKEFGTVWGRGYSCSPIAYKDLVILTTGTAGKSIIAFRQSDGTIAWQMQDFDYGPSSPILINVDGQDQLVVFMASEIAGVDPASGELLWRHPHKTDWGLNISTPVWGDGNLLFCSSAYSGGSRVLHLSRPPVATPAGLPAGKVAGKAKSAQAAPRPTVVKELWFSNRMRIHFGNAIRIGDTVYGTSGDFGPAFLLAVDVKTGREMWRDRSFARASSVYADGKMIILDEDGNLALVSVSPEGVQVHSRVQLLTRNAWTPPTLAGSRLYVRDRKTIRALDLK